MRSNSVNNYGPTCLLRYRLVLVIKGKRNIITEDISLRLRDIFISNAQLYAITLEEFSYEPNYVSFSISTRITSNLIRFINAYKTASSRLIKKEFSSIKSTLYKETFWSRYYCMITVGNNNDSDEIINDYLNRIKFN